MSLRGLLTWAGALLTVALLAWPTAASADDARGGEDLFLLPSGKGEALDGMYLRLLCQHIHDTPALSARYRHVYLAGEEHDRIQAAVDLLTKSRDKLTGQQDKTTVDAINLLNESVGRLDLSKAALMVCAGSAGESPGKDATAVAASVTAIMTQYQVLPGGRAGVQFTRLRATGHGALQAPAVDAGYVPLESASVEAGIRSLGVRLLRAKDEPIIGLAKPVLSIPPQHHCTAARAGSDCVMQSGELDLSVALDGTDFLSAQQSAIVPPKKWRITSDVAGGSGDDLVRVDEIEVTPRRAVARLHFRRSGHYTVRVQAAPTVELGESFVEVTDVPIDVRPQSVLVALHGPRDLSVHVDPVSNLVFTRSIAPRSAGLDEDLARRVVVAGADVVAFAAAVSDVAAPSYGLDGAVVPVALATAARRMVDEDAARQYFELDRSLDQVATLYVQTARFTASFHWCQELRGRIEAAVDKSTVGINSLNAWQEACIDRAEAAWKAALKNENKPASLHVRRLDAGYEATFVPGLGREQDVAPGVWSFRATSAFDGLTRRALGKLFEGSIYGEVGTAYSLSTDERLGLSARTTEGSTAEQEIHLTGMTAISFALRGTVGSEIDRGHAALAGSVGVGIPTLWSAVELEAWAVGAANRGDVDGEFLGRLSPWCTVSNLFPTRASAMSFMCRRLDVGASGGYSTSTQGGLVGIDVRTRIASWFQVGWVDYRAHTATDRSYLGASLALTL